MVYYRKYRPQTISELDLDSVREKLTAILKNSVPHALLFTGPKGLGKTSSARILAKAINCERKRLASSETASSENAKKLNAKRYGLNADFEPCNACAACISITSGSNIDVLEIDGASNRGVEEIRDLREKIKFTPASLAKKIYIIDEVHMLTTEAFNALLKTLEEPPSHAVFILCTTESWKLPPTISSRTFIVHFEKPTQEELSRSLMRIVKGENLKVDDDVLEKVFARSEGSFRDGAKLLEELSLHAKDNHITSALFEKLFKVNSIEKHVEELMISLEKKDATTGLAIIQKLSEEGVDFKLVNEEIVEILRKLLFTKLGFEKKTPVVSELTIDSIHTLLEYFQTSYQEMKNTVIPQLPLELVIVQWCMLEEVDSDRVGVESGDLPSGKAGLRVESLTHSTGSGQALKVESLNTYTTQETKNTIKQNLEEKNVVSNSQGQSLGNDQLFRKLLDEIKKENHTLAGILRSCKIGSITADTITFISPFTFHGERLKNEQALRILEKSVQTVMARNLKVHIEIAESKR